MACMLRLCFAGVAAFCATLVLAGGRLSALDYVTINRGGSQRELAGRVEVEAADGALLFQTPDGSQWMLLKDEIVSRRNDVKPFAPLTQDELARQLQGELPKFKIHKTRNYLIAYNTSDVYAQWVGALFEPLHAGFYNFWKT